VLRTPEADLQALDARLKDSGLSIDGVARVMPSLEDVFLDVVERA
jgi:hypothetical protein